MVPVRRRAGARVGDGGVPGSPRPEGADRWEARRRLRIGTVDPESTQGANARETGGETLFRGRGGSTTGRRVAGSAQKWPQTALRRPQERSGRIRCPRVARNGPRGGRRAVGRSGVIGRSRPPRRPRQEREPTTAGASCGWNNPLSLFRGSRPCRKTGAPAPGDRGLDSYSPTTPARTAMPQDRRASAGRPRLGRTRRHSPSTVRHRTADGPMSGAVIGPEGGG